MKRVMTEAEAKSFAENVYNYQHAHTEVDPMKAVAFYVLDLLRQGYTVNGIVKKLRTARELAGHDHRYGDCIVRFSQAIRLCKATEEWVSHHVSLCDQ